MTESAARAKDLDFTGIYDWNKSTVQERLNELRVKYPDCKFYLVNVPTSKLSRGCRADGYSVYSCKKYTAYKTVEQLTEHIKGYGSRKQYLTEQYLANLTMLDKENGWHKEQREVALKIINS